MKHLLNNLSEEEKNSIREQHEGGMKLDTSRFRTLLESKSGNVKPLVERFDDEDEDDTCPQCGRGGYSYESGCEDCDDEENEYRWDAEDDEEEIDEMVGVDYMSDELEEDLGFASHSGDFDGNDSEDEGYGEIFGLIDDECVNSKNDDDCVLFLNTIIEYCEDKLYEMGQYGGSDEEEDLGFAQHDGSFGGDDSEEEEELDLREFDDLEEDDETW